MNKILVTGGCGYVGTTLVEYLLKLNYKVIVVDLCWFGNYLDNNKNLKVLKKDFRDLTLKDLSNVDSVVHLANIANDQSVDLNPSLSWEVNVLGTYILCELIKKAKIKHLIYASSGSVYGVKKEKNVTEDLDLKPISVYNKTKMCAERIIMSYENNFQYHIIRPATVCGFSKRMRLDLTVNILTFQSLTKKKILVFGGSQFRPNIHILDLVDVYLYFIKKYNKISKGIYNAGFENTSVINLAKLIQKTNKSSIKIKKVSDIRSYRINSGKLLNIGFSPKYNLDFAINEIKEKFNKKEIKDKPNCYNINYMKNFLKISN